MKSKFIFSWKNGWGERQSGNTISTLRSLQADRPKDGGVAKDAAAFGAAKWELQLKHQDQLVTN